jgi:sortase A
MLISVRVLAQSFRIVASRNAVAKFQAGEHLANGEATSPLQDPAPGSRVDIRLCSMTWIKAYQGSFKKTANVSVAILRIPNINLLVPVFDGTDDLALNRGVGRIPGTSRVGQPGNLGIAGHRDGFFRGLKDVVPGDIVELTRTGQTLTYAVVRIQVVDPADTYVLNLTPALTLTLVTCFPFYFVGSAPKRYVVTASLETSHQAEQSANKNSVQQVKNKY